MSATTSARQILRGAVMIPTDRFPEEFWNVVETYRGELVNQALAILGDQSDAEDVAQETLCDAFRDRAKLAKVQSLGAWLRALNRTNALDRARGRSRYQKKKKDSQRMMPARPFTTGGFTLVELREALAKAIETLPDQQRSVVVLRFWESLSYEEIGKRLNLPTTTVWRTFYEASLVLHEKLKPSLEANAAGAAPEPSGAEEGA